MTVVTLNMCVAVVMATAMMLEITITIIYTLSTLVTLTFVMVVTGSWIATWTGLTAIIIMIALGLSHGHNKHGQNKHSKCFTVHIDELTAH